MGVNALLGAGAGALARGRPKAQPKREPAPSLGQLQAQRDAAYQAVDKSGHVYSPEQLSTLARSIADDLGKARINPARHPKAASMLEDITATAASGEPMTLTQLDQLRQIVRRDVASAADQSEARLGQRMIAQIDGFIDAAGGKGAKQIRNARNLNTRVRKLETLDEFTDAAGLRAASTGSGGNVDNAARQNVRRFIERTPNLTPAEQQAAERVVRGSRSQNALRQVGKLSPEGNGLMTALHVGAILPSGGMSGGVAIAGAVSKRVADAMTRRNVQALRDIIARGGEEAAQAVKALEDPAYAELRRQLANDLAVQAGVQGQSARGAASYGPR